MDFNQPGFLSLEKHRPMYLLKLLKTFPNIKQLDESYVKNCFESASETSGKFLIKEFVWQILRFFFNSRYEFQPFNFNAFDFEPLTVSALTELPLFIKKHCFILQLI